MERRDIEVNQFMSPQMTWCNEILSTMNAIFVFPYLVSYHVTIQVVVSREFLLTYGTHGVHALPPPAPQLLKYEIKRHLRIAAKTKQSLSFFLSKIILIIYRIHPNIKECQKFCDL